MNSSAVVVIEGQVAQNLPNTMFRVTVTDSRHPEMTDKTILCHMAGKMRRNHIRLLPGDRVRFEMTGYDVDRGRIVYKIK